jgi:glycosyltransferase involved in cell wall biosynthesis
MNVEAYIVCWNEEEILPFTLDHYSQFCDRIVVLDNYSDDSSFDIASKYPKVHIEQWTALHEENEEGEMVPVYDERALTNIKESCFVTFGQGADWVMVVDCDELYYHPQMREKLEEYMNDGINYPLVEGYEMISKNFPKYDGGLLVDKVKTGRLEPGMKKRCIFDPRVAVGSKLCFGSHGLFLREDLAIENEEVELKLLHYKDLSVDYKIRRRKELLARRSKWTTDEGLCGHWDQTPTQIKKAFKEYLKDSMEVI